MTSTDGTMKALVLVKTEGAFTPGPTCYHPAPVVDLPVPTPEPNQILVKVISAAFNHRDLFQRQSQYPGTIFHTREVPSVLGADAVGIVLSPNHPLTHKPVLIAPAVNWLTSPTGPDCSKPFGILGSVKQTGGRGTFAEYIVVGENDVVEVSFFFVSFRRNE